MPAGSLNVSSNGSTKCSNAGFFKAVGPLVPDYYQQQQQQQQGGLSLRNIADIIGGTYQNPASSGLTFTDGDAIEMETSVYQYHLDGSDDAPVIDTTDTSEVSSRLFVEMTPTSGDTFFGSVGDKMRFIITKWNFGTGRLRIRFATASAFSAGLKQSDHSTSYALLVLNGRSTSGNGPNGNMQWAKVRNQSTNISATMDTVNFTTATRTALDALSLTTPGDNVILEVERVSGNELRASMLDYQDNAFTSQTTMTANTPTVIDTNTSSNVPVDITHILIEEVSGSEIDLTVEKA